MKRHTATSTQATLDRRIANFNVMFLSNQQFKRRSIFYLITGSQNDEIRVFEYSLTNANFDADVINAKNISEY